MNRFHALFRHRTPPPPGAIYADERSNLFPEVARVLGVPPEELNAALIANLHPTVTPHV